LSGVLEGILVSVLPENATPSGKTQRVVRIERCISRFWDRKSAVLQENQLRYENAGTAVLITVAVNAG
jgi:hypothetical protein